MIIKIAGLQPGTYRQDDSYASYMHKQYALLEEVVKRENPYLACFAEAMTGPMFAVVQDDRWFSNAEFLEDGPTTTRMLAESKRLNVHIVYSIFEKRYEHGQLRYYNTACLVSPTRGLIGVYHKCHMPWMVSKSVLDYEKYYFKPGNSMPVFRLDNGVTVGILICYDRSFPEAWRMMQLQGAQIVCVPACTWGFRNDMFWTELRTRAFESHTFVVTANRAGEEHVAGEEQSRHHFGKGCIIDPMGNLLQAIEDEPWTYVAQEVDLEAITQAYKDTPWLRDRRPELYGLLTAAGANFGGVYGNDYIPTANKII